MAQPLLKLPNPKIGDGKVKLDIKVKGKKPNPFASGSLGGALVGAAGSVVGGLGKSLISGGLSSDVGEGVANIGGQLGGAISTVNPLLGGIVSAGSGLIGGGINALFGMKTNEALLNRANSNINAMTNFTSDATTTDDLQGVQSVANVGQVYEGGVFSGGEAERKNKELQDRLDGAVLMANRNVLNNANNIESNQINDALANYSAFGGFLGDGTGMGAIDYDFMTDYLTQKKRENDMKSKMNGIVPIPAFIPNSYAIGGDLQTNGGDFSSGLAHINAGLSHELNPNEGVQMGVDNEGIPNLVEQGETVYKDYVFSARIPIDATTKELFHIGKKREMTYADLSKKLEKEIAERVNDPISRSGFEKQMQMLEEQQERQKQEMEAERAKAAFEALSPEEQTALMQQRAEQEALAQQQAMVEQQAAMQQPTPEEAAMMQQQQMADGSEAALGQEPEMNCFGGKINRFDTGGVLKLLNKLGYKTVAEAEKAGWKPSDFGDYKTWTDIDSNSTLSDNFVWTDEFSKRLTTPEQKAALSLGWTPTAAPLSRKWYEGDNGNSVGWTQSVGKDALNAEEFNDYAERYKNTLGWAVDNGIIKAPEGNATVSMADIAKAMREAPDWKTTDNWLYSDIANQASYLGMARGLNPDDDTKFTDKWSPYGSFSKGADGNWSYTLKSDLTDAQKKAFTDQFRRARTDNQIGVMYNNFQDPTSVTNRYVLDEDGNPVLLTTDDLTGYEQLGSYTWGNSDDNKNNTAILYKSKNSAEEQPEKKIVPDLRKETSFGLFGPAVGLGLMGLGVGRPDTGSYDAAVSGAGDVTTARWKPLGNYLTYRPLDIWYAQNAMNAQSRATDRQLMNTSGGNRGAVMAGLLSNGYNSQLASGNLFRQAQEYNDNLRKQVADFNRGTDQFNSEQFGRTSQFNADAYNRARQADAQLRLHAASAKDDANRWWASNLYGNINGLFDNINQWEKWKRDHNTTANMYANGLAGVVSEDTPVARGYVKEREKSRGGKLKKRGLTI